MANTKYSPVVQELADLIKENSWEDKFAQAFAKVKSYNIPGLSDIDSVEKYLDWLEACIGYRLRTARALTYTSISSAPSSCSIRSR